jgi:RimJ/RimL family protein N-acetyltransferase
MQTIAVDTARSDVFRPFARPQIRTARLHLCGVSLSDAHEIAEQADDWQVARQTPSMPYPYSLNVAEDWVASAIAASRRGSDYILVIRRIEDGVLLGAAGLQINDDHAEIGYWLGRPYWGQGYATEAVQAVLDYARQELQLSHFKARVFVDNAPSARVLRKVGFIPSHEERRFFANRGGIRRVGCYELGAPAHPRFWQRLWRDLNRLLFGVGAIA